jgi:hypothetical protein
MTMTMTMTCLMASWHPPAIWASSWAMRRSASRLLERAACNRSRGPGSPGEVPDALLERCVLGSDPLRAALEPFVYQVADLAREGRDPVALNADLRAAPTAASDATPNDSGQRDKRANDSDPRRLTQIG